MQPHHLKYLITTLLFLLLVGGGYVLVSRVQLGGDTAEMEDLERRAAVVERDIVSQNGKLSQVQLDDSLFKLPAYTALVDFTVTPAAPALIRPNPFIEPR